MSMGALTGAFTNGLKQQLQNGGQQQAQANYNSQGGSRFAAPAAPVQTTNPAAGDPGVGQSQPLPQKQPGLLEQLLNRYRVGANLKAAPSAAPGGPAPAGYQGTGPAPGTYQEGDGY
jgi:hypothetical protein